MKFLILLLMASIVSTFTSVHDFVIKSIDGKEIDLKQFKGKKILVVNTASECGYTPQYTDLQKLADAHQEKLVVVGFPANNFGGQEPGSNEEIASFCKKNYGVSFLLSEKVSVKGDDIHPLFKHLVSESGKLAKEQKGETTQDHLYKKFLQDPLLWNFTKFLVDEEGKLIGVFHYKVNPLSQEITQHL